MELLLRELYSRWWSRRGFETLFRGDGTRPYDKNVIVVNNIIIAEEVYSESAIYVIS